jgi:hypothetical protein
VHIDQKIFDGLSLSTSPEGDVFPFNVQRTAVFNTDRIRRDLDYHPTPFHDYMRTTIEWCAARDRGPSNGYARRAEELSAIRRSGTTRDWEQ